MWNEGADHSTQGGLNGTINTATGGLKPPWPQGHVGSIPTPGTTLNWCYILHRPPCLGMNS